MAPATVAQAIDRVLTAYAGLAELGEEIEDEWSYVNDLATAWRERLETVADGDPDRILGDDVDAAIDRAIDEIGRITDPHRAIDWLSTFPQVTLVALGEAP
jgi:hypothetical protein